MLFGFVAIVLPPAPSWSRRYVPAYTTFLLKKRHPCLYHSSTCATASSACGSTPALSTAAAMSRAMAMTALINKLTSRPAVPSARGRAEDWGSATEAPRRPLTDHSAGEVLHRVVQLASL